nr:MAG TPA: hypothetical protein [Caudoviricetes sp.]
MSWLKHQRVRCNRIIRFHRYKLLRDPRRFDSAHDHDSYFYNYKYTRASCETSAVGSFLYY